MKRHLGESLHLFMKGNPTCVFIQENILIVNNHLSYLIKYILLSIHGLFILFTLVFLEQELMPLALFHFSPFHRPSSSIPLHFSLLHPNIPLHSTYMPHLPTLPQATPHLHHLLISYPPFFAPVHYLILQPASCASIRRQHYPYPTLP